MKHIKTTTTSKALNIGYKGRWHLDDRTQHTYFSKIPLVNWKLTGGHTDPQLNKS
jgi:hypothetical protein